MAYTVFATCRFRGRAEQFDTLIGYSSILDWSVEAGTLTRVVAEALAELARQDPEGALQALDRAGSLRDAIFEGLTQLAVEGDVDESHLEPMNRFLRDASRHRVIGHDARGRLTLLWKIGANLEAPLWPIIHSASVLLGSEERGRVR